MIATDTRPRRCPGCKRCRRACLVMPCGYLARLVDKSRERHPDLPSLALRAWAKLGGNLDLRELA